jgi:hypothetical protein
LVVMGGWWCCAFGRERLADEQAILREQTQLMQAQFTETHIKLQVAMKEQRALEAKLAELGDQKRVRSVRPSRHTAHATPCVGRRFGGCGP